MDRNVIIEKYNAAGRHAGFHVHLYSDSLDEYKYLSAIKAEVLLEKVEKQKVIWNLKWEKEQENK